jgi:hypothetical protein
MKNSEISKRVVKDKNNFAVKPIKSKYSVMGANQIAYIRGTQWVPVLRPEHNSRSTADLSWLKKGPSLYEVL